MVAMRSCRINSWLLVLDRCAHRIESLREPAELVVAGDRHTVIVVAPCDFGCPAIQFTHRFEDATGQTVRQYQSDEHREQPDCHNISPQRGDALLCRVKGTENAQALRPAFPARRGAASRASRIATIPHPPSQAPERRDALRESVDPPEMPA